MPRSGYTTMASRKSRTRTTLLVALVLLTILDAVSGIPYKRSLLRLCSKSLSDALYLACKDRGYNEPFSYSGEDDPQDSVGPGLAEECCYHTCSYTQLEQYCKPMSDKESAGSSDAVKKSLWIVNLPYPSVRPETSSEERSKSEINYAGGTLKCKIGGLNVARKKGINDREDDGGCNGKSIAGSGKKHRRHCRCRRRQQRRRRPGKALERALVTKLSNIEQISSISSKPARKISSLP